MNNLACIRDDTRGLGQRTRAGAASNAAIPPRTCAAARQRCRSSTRSRACGAEKLWRHAHHPAVRECARRAHRQPGDAAGQGRAQGDLSVRLAGRGRRQRRRPDVSRPVAVPGSNSVPQRGQAHQQHAAARRPARITPKATTASTGSQPIVADAEAGFGGVLNAFELMKAMIEAGAAGVHFEDQLASRQEMRPHGRQGAGAHAAKRCRSSSPRGWPRT